MKFATGQRVGPISIRDYERIAKFKKNYSTEDSLEYRAQIRVMNMFDLHKHAVRVGVIPSSDRKRLETILASRFEDNKRNYKLATFKNDPEGGLTKEQEKEIQELNSKYGSR